MRFADLLPDALRLPAPLPIRHARVDAAGFHDLARAMAEAHVRLVALWTAAADPAAGTRASAHAAYAAADGLAWVEVDADDGYPDLAGLHPAAARMQRAAADLTGVRARAAADLRPWLDHGAWEPPGPALAGPTLAGPTAGGPARAEAAPGGAAPGKAALAGPAPGKAAPGAGAEAGAGAGAAATVPAAGPAVADYPFVRVEGDGVHEIAVGPVHAGIIEPGHFRFSAVGEKVLRLEARLGYVHKGIERRFTELDPRAAVRLAARVSGDSTVAHAWAYAMALESAAGCTVPPRAQALRALLLERERVANHLGDLGALGNDVALAFGLAQFSRLREDWQRRSAAVFGHRLLMDTLVAGGVAAELGPADADRIRRDCDGVERELQELRTIYDEHPGLQDRLSGTGRVERTLALRLGLSGPAARASGVARDLRDAHPWPPYDGLAVRVAVDPRGDVAARVSLRFDEALESLRLIRAIAGALPAGPLAAPLQLPSAPARGAGWVEGWRGEVLAALWLAGPEQGHRIVRCHCHDPSWHNWPALEHAVIGNIVPDFPLINKSFNLSYAGHDL